MAYFWYSYSIYLILGMVLISLLISNNWIINSLIVLIFIVFIYQSHDSYVANQLCSCFPILRDGYNETRTLPKTCDDACRTEHEIRFRKNFVDCAGEKIGVIYRDMIQISDVNNENIESDTWNGTPFFNPKYKQIVQLIESRCPDLVAEVNFLWVDVRQSQN